MELRLTNHLVPFLGWVSANIVRLCTDRKAVAIRVPPYKPTHHTLRIMSDDTFVPRQLFDVFREGGRIYGSCAHHHAGPRSRWLRVPPSRQLARRRC